MRGLGVLSLDIRACLPLDKMASSFSAGEGSGRSGERCMRPTPEGYGWKSLESAPLDEDVSLQVTDGRGKPYILVNASRLTAAGWVSSNKGTPLAVTPLMWRPYFPPRGRRPR
jgi:hypothetical protein